MKSNLKIIKKPKVRRQEAGKYQKEAGEGLGGCRRGQEVEDEINENKIK
jgi:hypothetical protein